MAHIIAVATQERHGLSNHRPPDCLLDSLFGRENKKVSQFRITGRLWRELWPVDSLTKSQKYGKFLRHHVIPLFESNITIQN